MGADAPAELGLERGSVGKQLPLFCLQASKIQGVWVVYGYDKIKKRSVSNLCMNTAQVLNHDDVFLTVPVKCFCPQTNDN